MKRSQIVVGNYTYPYHSYDYFLDSMERLGIENIELWGSDPHVYFGDQNFYEVSAIGKKIRSRGMNVRCVTPEQVMYPINIAHENRDARSRSVEFFRRHIDIANILEAPKVLVTSGRCNLDGNWDECFKNAVDSLQELGYYARKRGVCIAFEPLVRKGYDMVVYAKDLKELLDAVDDYEGVKGMIDVDEAARVDESPKDFVEQVGIENLNHVHFIDGMPGGHLALGDGVLPLERYLDELDAAGYESDIALEIMDGRYYFDPEPSIKKSLEFFENYMNTH